MTHAPSSNVASWLTSSPHTTSPAIHGIATMLPTQPIPLPLQRQLTAQQAAGIQQVQTQQLQVQQQQQQQQQQILQHQTVDLAALGIVGGNVSIGNAGTAAAPVAKKRPSTSTLGTIAINDIIATRTHPTPVSDGQVTVSVGNQDTQKEPIATGRIGYAGCQAPVASASTKELRLKGSSFLRRHASRHGIANASRKLTAQVIRELSQHYYTAHKVVVADDDLQIKDPSTSNGNTNGNTGAAGKAKNIQVSSPDQARVVSNENGTKKRIVNNTNKQKNGHNNDPVPVTLQNIVVTSNPQQQQQLSTTAAAAAAVQSVTPIPLMLLPQQTQQQQQQQQQQQLQQQQQHQQMVQQMMSQQTETGLRLQQQQLQQRNPPHVATKSKPANIIGATTAVLQPQTIPMIQQPNQQVNHLHPQTQHQQITVTALPEQYNPTISNSPTIINNTYYATGTVAASAAAAALAAAGGPPQTATISNHNNAQQNQNVTNRSQQGTNQQPKSYTAGRRRNSNLPTSSTGENTQSQATGTQSGSGSGSTGQCLVGCLGKTKRELQTFGTSRLRPEAAAHRVHNASRKPKDQVIEELWNHYLEFHQKDLQPQQPSTTTNGTTNATNEGIKLEPVSTISGIQAVPVVISSNASLQQLYTTTPGGVITTTDPGWIGNVVDDEETEQNIILQHPVLAQHHPQQLHTQAQQQQQVQQQQQQQQVQQQQHVQQQAHQQLAAHLQLQQQIQTAAAQAAAQAVQAARTK